MDLSRNHLDTWNKLFGKGGKTWNYIYSSGPIGFLYLLQRAWGFLLVGLVTFQCLFCFILLMSTPSSSNKTAAAAASKQISLAAAIVFDSYLQLLYPKGRWNFKANWKRCLREADKMVEQDFSIEIQAIKLPCQASRNLLVIVNKGVWQGKSNQHLRFCFMALLVANYLAV